MSQKLRTLKAKLVSLISRLFGRFGALFDRMRPREAILSLLTVFTIVLVSFYLYLLLPGYKEWQELRGRLSLERVEYGRLRTLLEARSTIRKEFSKMEGRLEQADSDEVTMSNFLRSLEAAARFPSLTLINMNPLGVKETGGKKIYSVKLSVGGKLHDVLRFISSMTEGENVTGVESFVFRGVQGGQMVEASFALWMVRLGGVEKGRGGK